MTDTETETSTEASTETSTETTEAGTDAAVAGPGGEQGGAPEAPATEQELVDEGDIAADFIEELLDIADIDGDIDIDARSGRAYVSISAGDSPAGGLSLDVLSKPDTVTALQELTRMAVQAKTGRFSRLILDIGGSRDARADELAALVDHAVTRIEGGASSASLPPMSSYERKLVHDLVSERGEFVSESEGEGRDRHTVIRRSS